MPTKPGSPYHELFTPAAVSEVIGLPEIDIDDYIHGKMKWSHSWIRFVVKVFCRMQNRIRDGSREANRPRMRM